MSTCVFCIHTSKSVVCQQLTTVYINKQTVCQLCLHKQNQCVYINKTECIQTVCKQWDRIKNRDIKILLYDYMGIVYCIKTIDYSYIIV